MNKNRTFKKRDARDYDRVYNPRKDSNIHYLPFLINPDEYELDGDILEVVENVPFNKISIPLQCNRSIIEEGGDPNRYMTVGNILSYNPKNRKFKVIIHKRYNDIIEQKLSECADGELVAMVQCSEYNGRFNCITKICVDLVDYESDDIEEVDESELVDAEEFNGDSSIE
jgi:hypothetical protein